MCPLVFLVFMNKLFKKTCPGVPEVELIALEDYLCVKLPDDYRDFLKKTNGGQPLLDNYSYVGSVSKKRKSVYIKMFYSCKKKGWGSLYELKRIYIDTKRMPKNTMPICEITGGDFLFIELGENKSGVYIWNHEFEDESIIDEEGWPKLDSTRLICDSFRNFIINLTKDD